ncbi:hypothetical protein Baya_12883 [Bagarius yarrelli]|uniref:Uncharacterized protein n=1 Tax=Bagarius yarrelli TaxID=175774 RepID=A0A556V4E0_BAGYA|nr:hypothetical protein Baya_12883 [Bagarius yarrelli]
MALEGTAKTGVADLQLRHLLFATGAAAAATAAGMYFYVKWSNAEKTSDHKDTTSSQDPVCKQATEQIVLQPSELLQDQMTKPVAVAEEKIKKLVMSNTQLEDRVRELEELLCEAFTDCDIKSEPLFFKGEKPPPDMFYSFASPPGRDFATASKTEVLKRCCL